MYRFELPDVGEGIVEAEILAWKVRVGDWVHEDQVLVELLTDKAEIEVPSPVAGRVERLHFEVGARAPVGAVLIEIDDASASGPEDSAEEAETESRPKGTPEPASGVEPSRGEARRSAGPGPPLPVEPSEPPPRPGRRPRAVRGTAPAVGASTGVDAVPAVRALAKRLGVDLAQLRGSGPRGRIMRRDVEAAAAARAVRPSKERAADAAPPPVDEAGWTRTPLRGLRRAIAHHMAHARRTAAHFTYVEEVDLTALLAAAAKAGFAGSPLPFIAHASVRSLAEHPMLNASIDDAREEIVLKPDVHLGIATATEEGLLVPVLRNAVRLSVVELRDAIGALARRARERELPLDELRGSTFTITSLGKLGGLISTPIVNHPEVAILGVNRVREVPGFEGERVVRRRVMNLSLSVDHRIADGLVAARFVAEVKRVLEQVEFAELARLQGEGQS